MDKLTVNVISATGLRNADRGSNLSDPYVTIWVGSRNVAQTQVVKDNLNPFFHFVLPVALTGECPEGTRIRFEIRDKDLIGSSYLGEVSVPFADVKKAGPAGWKGQKIVKSTMPKVEVSGTLNVGLLLEPMTTEKCKKTVDLSKV
mmetsp:Transcript_55373/g.135828  ORF Transcript_55373/g.135828 Transcript_55373/m.135828 type:complete len:145 (+) Transcript_55373:90-524(+)|eukprot:CAMPEP_0198312560 /NCGR_PEP_ID=MMETSP1450-20131203/3886_1 /TAXON_ID=753684 ORGANISM="Madagascaria erythrocladiodes, Strain CCMP3234" /NCGR_SAMPLE_ID=MMETSP1450 /ASSEMBLY_ACC=CAM_ASM_001115 /LENGTH=144 /DNA_ID=CAMNT_0044015509 /DNA_START=218 /DNA_END=652 /DNA_ORIENTATION=-